MSMGSSSPLRMSSYRVSSLGEDPSVGPRESAKISSMARSGLAPGECSPTKSRSPAHLRHKEKIEFDYQSDLSREQQMSETRAQLEAAQLKRIHGDPEHMREYAKQVMEDRESLLQARAAVDAHATELERRSTETVMHRNRAELSATARAEAARRAYHKQVQDDNRRMMEDKKRAAAEARMHEKEYEQAGHATAYFSRFGSSMR
jgi:hypothetical protein